MVRLNAILDVDVAARAGWAPEDLSRAFLDGGVRLLQIRAKRLDSAPFLAMCDRVVRAARDYGAEIIVNDRADLARLSGAAGVHVGQEDLPPRAARAFLGPSAIVGFSTHTVEQLEAAIGEPVTYIAVGPVFGTTTKDTGYSAVGLDLVRTARRLVPAQVPIVAIGGITLATAASVIEAGASTVAVIGDLLAGNPQDRAALYCRTLL
jgi:thiamine-phosphate pyrophosphorylase